MKMRSFIFSVTLLFTGAAHAEKLRVYLDWFPNAEFAGMFVAKQKGWYKDASIELETVFNGLDIIPNVLKGDADIGMDSAHDLIKHINRGAKIKAFAAQYQLNPNSIAVPKDSPIRSIRDLKGKKLGIFSPQEYEMYRVMLGNSELTLKDVLFVPIKTFQPEELIEIFKSKKVDAFIAWEFNWTITFALLGYEVKVFPGYQNGFHYYGIVYFAPEKFIQKKTALLARFLSVTRRGWTEVYKNPEFYAAQIVEQVYPKKFYIGGSKDLTLKQQILELRLRKKYFYEGVGPGGMGMMTDFSWKRSLEISKQFGILPEESLLKPEDFYVDTILRKASL